MCDTTIFFINCHIPALEKYFAHSYLSRRDAKNALYVSSIIFSSMLHISLYTTALTLEHPPMLG